MSILIDRIPIETFKFPGGESHVKVLKHQIPDSIAITALLNSNDRILELLLTIDAIRRIKPIVKIKLTIPYFPYGRQDRVCNSGEALSVKVMANLINNLKCDRVTVIDPHSDVTPALLNNCQVINQSEIIGNSNLADKIKLENWALIAPDAGAGKKIRDVAQIIASRGCIPDVFYGDKVRETKTGKIKSTTFQGNVEGRQVIIIDDICDGGRTFIELAKVLQNQGAKEIYLYVTHGIFSQGLEVLQPYFNQIYCYHTTLLSEQINQDFLTIL